ncbi:hypothetical protein D3C84_678730 [compost metagenome]
MDPGRHGGKDGRPQGAALIRGHHLDGPVHHVGAGLHHGGRLAGDAAKGDHLLHRHLLTGHALHDAAGPEGGGGHQGAKEIGRIGAEVDPREGALQALVGIGGAAAVEPVEHHRQVGQIALLLPGGGEAG